MRERTRPVSRQSFPMDPSGSRYPDATLMGQVCYGAPSGDAELYGAVRTRLARSRPDVLEAHVARRLCAVTPVCRDELTSALVRLAADQGVDMDAAVTHMGVVSSRTGAHLPQLVRQLHTRQATVLARIAVLDTRIAGLLASPSEGGLLGAIATRDLDSTSGSHS